MKTLKNQWIVRSAIALTLLVALSVMAIAAAPQASAHTRTTTTCGTFVPVGPQEHSDLVVNGATVGYVESLTDGCGNYEEHGHATASSAYNLLLMSGDNYAVSSGSGTTQDVYLSLQNGGSPTYAFLEIDFSNTGALYYAGY